MTNQILKILKSTGPTRSSVIVKKLGKYNISAATARQQISRAKDPIIKFPIQLLPKRESFVYLKDQRHTEQFWPNFHNAMRETNTVYASAIDGLINRGGMVETGEFSVISGAPIRLKKQVCVDMVIGNLIKSGVIEKEYYGEKEYISIIRDELFEPNINHCRTLRLAEDIILAGMHEWARNIGLASYNKILVRGDLKKPKVGQFMWDLTGPSYILGLCGKKSKQGFLVVDVFAQGIFKETDIKYFVKKVRLLQASVPNIRFIPILIAEGFDSSALKYGKGFGIMPASIKNIFGSQVAQSIQTLIQTLNKAAEIATGNPEKLVKLLEDLFKIEGAAGNLRGVLFELICVYLAKIDGGSVYHSVRAIDPKTGKQGEIDVLHVFEQTKCIAIECKGKGPGGIVNECEVRDWIKQLPVFRAYLNNQDRFRESVISFEIWTTGTFSKDAINLLKKEKSGRVKNLIDWKEGKDVLNISKKGKQKGITDALNQHYLKHPLAS